MKQKIDLDLTNQLSRGRLKYVCPSCSEVHSYSKLEWDFAKQDGCCHQCVHDEEDSDKDYGY